MSKSLGNSSPSPRCSSAPAPIDLRFYIVAAHYRSHVEFSFEALDEAAAGFARIEHFLTGRCRCSGPACSGRWGRRRPGAPSFEPAMDDDLGTPAAVAAIYEAVREGNRLLAAGGVERPGRRRLVGARRCWRCLGVDPFDPRWSTGGSVRPEAG